MIRKTGSLHLSSSKYVRFLFLYSSVPWHSLYNNPSPASARQLNTFGPSKLFPVSPCPISEYLIEDTTQEAQQGDGQRGNLPYSSERLQASGQWSQTTTFTPVLNTYHGHVHDICRQPLLTPAQCAESTADQGPNAASILCCGLKPGWSEGIPRMQGTARAPPLQLPFPRRGGSKNLQESPFSSFKEGGQILQLQGWIFATAYPREAGCPCSHGEQLWFAEPPCWAKNSLVPAHQLHPKAPPAFEKSQILLLLHLHNPLRTARVRSCLDIDSYCSYLRR